MAIDKIVLQATNNLFTNTEISGTEAARMPVGTTGQRANEQNGDIRFNSTLDLMEYYDGSIWKSIDSPPTISSVTSTFTAAGDTITVNGDNYQTGVNIVVIDSGGTQYTPDSVTRVSSTQATFDITTAILNSGNDYFDVKITNVSGLSVTASNVMSIPQSIAFSTAAGTLGTADDVGQVSGLSPVTVTQSGENADVSVTYAVESGALPGGLTLNTSTGAITGDPTNVSSDTTYNFNIDATYVDASSSETATINRAFNIIIQKALDGSSSDRGMLSGRLGYLAGATSGTKYVRIEGNSYQLTYDATDKFGDGKVGWVRLNGNFFASNQSLRTSASNINQAGVTAGYSGNGFYLGDDANSLTSNTSMAYVQMKIPDCTSARMTTITATASGAQSPDDNTNWINSYPGTDTNSYVALKTPTTPNIGGYPFAIWNNASNANYTNGGVIYPKPGAEFTSLVTPNSATVNSGFNTASFSSEVDNPKFVCFAGDSGTERLTFTAWEMWVH
jgi:large repetitive protein